MTPVEVLVRELVAVQDQLIALPDDEFGERFELLRRQDELRFRAAQHAEGADQERPTEDLLAELVGLRVARADGETSPRRTGRIARIEDVLTGRGVDPR